MSDMKEETTGDELRRIRVAAGKTQRQVATMIGVAELTVRNWEAGRHEPKANVYRELIARLRALAEEARDVR